MAFCNTASCRMKGAFSVAGTFCGMLHSSCQNRGLRGGNTRENMFLFLCIPCGFPSFPCPPECGTQITCWASLSTAQLQRHVNNPPQISDTYHTYTPFLNYPCSLAPPTHWSQISVLTESAALYLFLWCFLQELTCTYTHYFTQPMPNALAWLAHHGPAEFHELEVALTFFEQLVLPFLILVPVRAVRIVTALLEMGFQVPDPSLAQMHHAISKIDRWAALPGPAGWWGADHEHIYGVRCMQPCFA